MTKTLKKGAKGPDVKKLQEALNKAGAKPRLKTDSAYGKATEKAVMDFQKKKRMKPDGVAGAKTWAALSGKGGQAQAPKWPHEDYAGRIKALEKNTKDLVVGVKKTLMAMDSHLDDFEVEQIRNKYFNNFRTYLAFHKKWMAEAGKVVKFKQSFDKLTPRNPEAGDPIVKAAANTIKNLQRISNKADPLLLENVTLEEKFQKHVKTKKKAA